LIIFSKKSELNLGKILFPFGIIGVLVILSIIIGIPISHVDSIPNSLFPLLKRKNPSSPQSGPQVFWSIQNFSFVISSSPLLKIINVYICKKKEKKINNF